MSDSNMRRLNSLVVGTAGHIDHGKTSLVYALTGIDTDRLKEEKRRGISIDLGFAQMQLPDGRGVSFVDVPGHERFVRNMLAGAAGMEALMLIVAANESVMPQTREHFEICQLLGLRHGLVVITKSDLATAEQLAKTRIDIANLIAGSFLAGAAVLEVSALTGAGLDELKRQLSDVTKNETGRDRDGVTRMPIDRAFAVKGFGTVVTGTLLAGSVRVGETLQLHPGKARVRVRGLQTQHASVEQVEAGQRVAVNLAGVEHQEIKRGYVLMSADALSGSRVMDVEMHWLAGVEPPSARQFLTAHLGTAEISAKFTLYPPHFARLRLTEEVVALPGDHFVIRRPSPTETVGGGVVADAFPPTRLGRAKTLARLQEINRAPLERRVELLVDEAAAGRSLAELVKMTGIQQSQIKAAIGRTDVLVLSGNDRVVTRHWIEDKRQAVLIWLQDFHKANPQAQGAPLAAARLGMEADVAGLVFKGLESVRIQGEIVALASHRAEFSTQETLALERLEHAFHSGCFQPPTIAEAMAIAGVDMRKGRSLLEALVKRNRLVKLPEEMIFHFDVIAHIRASLAQHKGRKFSVAEFKGWMNISRKFAIPLLEYLDQQRVTRREGDVRIVI